MAPLDSIDRTTTPVQQRRGAWPQIYFGVAVTTLASLLLELSLTRVFSVIFYYHFAFLAISIALFGLGAGGIFSYVIAGWRGTIFGKLGKLAVLNALAVVACILFLLSRKGELNTGEIAAVYFACAVPFLFSGAIVSLAIADTIERVDRVYFFDLIGAAAGCAVLVPLLNWVGGPNTILVSASLFGLSAAIWFHLAHAPRGRIVAVSLALFLVGLIAYNMKYPVIDVHYAKGQKLTGEEFVRWNSFSRIAMKKDPDFPTRSLFIDGDAQTGIAQFDFKRLTEHDKRYLKYHGPGFPYILRPGAKTLIIGAGGGWDVSRAIASGSKDVTGVEINPIIANTVMKKRFPQYSNWLYFRPDVKIVVEDGRSFVRNSKEKYQVLQATLVDTWASTAAGAFALSENNLYTTDAFRDYLSHLTDDGVMAFTRWGFDPPRESLRVVSLTQAALKGLGENNPAAHVAVIREDMEKISKWGAQDTILVARKPFSAADLSLLRESLAIAKMDAVYLPDGKNDSAFRQLLTAGDTEKFFDQYAFDIRPVGDNRPFFFYTTQPRDVWTFLTSASKDTADYKVNKALPLLFGLVIVSILATVLILAMPPLLLKNALPPDKRATKSLLFFVGIGIGYILIQVALIQKFVLFLGHPTYALTVIIFSMLLSSGLGSFVSRRLISNSLRRLSYVMAFIFAGIIFLALTVTPITQAGVGLPLIVKGLITVALIAPVGFAMGMPFPTGLTKLEASYPSAIRWAWAINSAASVLGSAAAIFLAIYLGLQATLVIGGICYLAAWLIAAQTLFGKNYSDFHQTAGFR